MPTEKAAPPWLLLVHQLPPKPTNARVRIWRRLQDLGALALKNSVYVLPNSPESREDLEWVRSEVVGLGGEATVFAADSPADLPRTAIVDLFQRARSASYEHLAHELERLGNRGPAATAPARRARERALRTYRQRLAAIERIDFFGAPGRRELAARLDTLERALRPAPPTATPPSSPLTIGDYRGRRWVTRPRPGVDRMASAWLVRRFIDPAAKFHFANTPSASTIATAFDMFGGAFAHEHDACTFEVLQRRFGLADAAITRVAEIVHDCDLRTDRYATAERAAIESLVAGLRLTFADDSALLESGITMFEALYRSFTSAATPPTGRSGSRVGLRPGRKKATRHPTSRASRDARS